MASSVEPSPLLNSVTVTPEEARRPLASGNRPWRADADAVALFVERAQAVRPGYAPDPVELQTVSRICERLDGLPLAIELAAARAGVLNASDIADRLEDPGLLQHPSRTAPSRHLTLDAALEWSYRLLNPAEQTLFRRLSVFHGTFSLLAAESIGSDDAINPDGGINKREVLPILGGLVDRSLVQVADRGAEKRYRLLQTVRHYARAKLASSPEFEPVMRAHSKFFLNLALQGQAGLEGPDQERWLERLHLEHDNLLAVLRRHLPADPETGGRLVAMLWPFWYRRGYYPEARPWLEEAVTLSAEMSPHAAAEVLTAAGGLALLQCEYDVAIERLDRALVLHEASQQRVGVATVLQRLGSVAREQGRYEDARRLHTSSRANWEELGDPAGIATSDDYLGFVAWLEGDLNGAEKSSGRSLAYFEGAGRLQEMAAALVNLGAAAFHRRDDRAAVDRLERAVSISREIGYLEGVAWGTHELGSIMVGTDPSANGLLCESLTTHAQLGDRWRTASALETIATRMLAATDPTLAVRLLAASDALRDTLAAPVPPVERPALEDALAALRAGLGSQASADAWKAGLSVQPIQAVELARAACTATTGPAVDTAAAAEESEQGVRSAGRSPGRAVDGLESGLVQELTGREIEVLELLSDGLTNREIAEQLYISTGTAGVHVSNILRKLGVSTRVQAATMAHRLGLRN